MSLFKQVSEDWKNALKAKSPEKEPLAAIRAELQMRAKNDKVPELADDVAISVIGKLSETFKESLGFARQAARDDLVSEAELKIAVAQRYLPSQLSEAEVQALVTASIAEVGATTQKDYGKVMKVLMPRVKGRTDGSKVQELVKSLLV